MGDNFFASLPRAGSVFKGYEMLGMFHVNVISGILFVQFVTEFTTEVLRDDETIGALEAGADLQNVRFGVDAMRELVGYETRVRFKISVAEAANERIFGGVGSVSFSMQMKKRWHFVAIVAELATIQFMQNGSFRIVFGVVVSLDVVLDQTFTGEGHEAADFTCIAFLEICAIPG